LCGGAFFAVPFLGLSLGAMPSILIGATAFGASELLLNDKSKDDIKIQKANVKYIIKKAKKQIRDIKYYQKRVEGTKFRQTISSICKTCNKIIDVVESKPSTYNKISNFFDYYLPYTLNTLKKYDDIENQSLSSAESKTFMATTKDSFCKIDNALKKMLDNLYSKDIDNANAEMKVLDMMLNSEGLTEDDFKRDW